MVFKSYSWKIPQSVPADVAGAEMERIERERGTVSAEALLDESRPVEAPLHKLFEWDDTIAAEKYRLHQSAKIICNLTVTVKKKEAPPQTVRAFVNVSDKRQGRFISVCAAMQSEEHRQIVLQSALAELESFQNKYAGFSELAKVFSEIDKVIRANRAA